MNTNKGGGTFLSALTLESEREELCASLSPDSG